MNIYIDTEFFEGSKQRRVMGIKVGAPVPTIDLISIGMVREDGREFYALNADCELEYPWADEWVRENVLRPIWEEYAPPIMRGHSVNYFSLDAMRNIFKGKGTARHWLGWDILKFTQPEAYAHFVGSMDEFHQAEFDDKPEFYGYYADYDWVVICQLFGRMMNLPKSFPMFCNDLNQMRHDMGFSDEDKRRMAPDPVGEHNALVDARWNKAFHEAMIKHGPYSTTPL